MTAKVKFSYGRLVFNVGDEVPNEIAVKYPHLVSDAPVKEKKEVEVTEEKNEIMFSTQKVRKKKNEI